MHDPSRLVEPEGPPVAQGSRAAQLTLVAFFLALLPSALLIQTAIEMHRGERVGALEIFRQKPTSANLRSYEHGLEDDSVLARTARPVFQFAQFAWLRDGGQKALLGSDGWLFYRPGYDAMLAGAPPRTVASEDPAAAIVAWRDALAARGIHLLVVPAPNKESVYPDRLTRRAADRHGVVSPVTRDLMERLHSAGVECVDLFEVFAKARANAVAAEAPLYLAQDSHWSPAGVALAARHVAQRLVEKGWIPPGATAYVERPAAVQRVGDVLRMMQSPPLERRFPPESVPCMQVILSETAEPYKDDVNSEILVLGDSFLRIYETDEPGAGGFIAHLARELKQPLTSLVNDGGASTLVRQDLSRRPAWLANKKVVIWEFVERDLLLGTEGWQRVPLPPVVRARTQANAR